VRLFIATLMLGGALLVTERSEACGGCFGPPSALTTVTGHRMAFAVSEERTVLWDQFEYSGAPEDFSWVLPVLPGAYLEASTDAWFESLETVTQTRVLAPPISCAQASGSGCGVMRSAGASDSSAANGSGFYGDDVKVIHRGTVGPYETVTLRSTDAAALTTWLTANGYVVPPDIQPTIDAYVSEGTDFVALRLKPGQGVQQMTPVRVVTPGGDYLLPLRMVAAGVAESVKIVLYVIGEKRYAMPDLHEVSLDTKAVEWTFADGSSNYAELRRQALAKNLGFSYLPTFAFVRAFGGGLPGPFGGSPIYSTTKGIVFNDSFPELYFAQAQENDAKAAAVCPDVASLFSKNELVSEDGADGTLPASQFSCDGYTDLSAAVLGMHPSSVWLTRLELDLPKEALSMDCVVVPAESQESVSNLVQALKASDRPPGCAEVVFESRMARGIPGRVGATAFLAAIGACLWLRRRGARS
jgi:hypothetical protein